MENTEKLYENLMARLKKPPHLPQTEVLQKNIMQRIEFQSKNEKRMTIYRFTGVISGIAACLLAGLLLYETIQYPAANPLESNTINRQNSVMIKEIGQNYSFNPTNNAENLKIIASILRQKQIENKKREQFYASFLDRIN
jgi:hypothetical protein